MSHIMQLKCIQHLSSHFPMCLLKSLCDQIRLQFCNLIHHKLAKQRTSVAIAKQLLCAVHIHLFTRMSKTHTHTHTGKNIHKLKSFSLHLTTRNMYEKYPLHSKWLIKELYCTLAACHPNNFLSNFLLSYNKYNTAAKLLCDDHVHYCVCHIILVADDAAINTQHMCLATFWPLPHEAPRWPFAKYLRGQTRVFSSQPN